MLISKVLDLLSEFVVYVSEKYHFIVLRLILSRTWFFTV